MTTSIKGSPIRIIYDQAEIFAQKSQLIIKIKQVMLDRNISNLSAAQMATLSEKEFKELIAGEYTSYPLAYLRTLHKRISTGEA